MKDYEIVRKGATDIAFLSLLAEKDLYGYEIRQILAERSNHLYSITDGSLYICLYRMSEKGYVSERKELVGKRRTRVYYHLEPKGWDFLYEYYDKTVNSIKGLETFYKNTPLVQEGEGNG